MITLWRIIVASWKHLTRNTWIALATVFVFMMAILSVNILLGTNAMLGRVVTLLENKVDMTVAFKPGVSDAVVNQARFYLTSLPQVQTVQWIPANEVLAAFKTRHTNDPKVLAALDEVSGNPLGSQLVIKAKQSDDYPFLSQAIQNPQYKTFIQSQTYDDHHTAVTRVREISRNVRLVGAALVAIFSLFGLLIAFNAIRVAIYTQREEIAIMRLVGASSFFIRGPFIFEGLWLAILTLIFSVGSVALAVVWLEPTLRPLFDGADSGLASFFLGQWPLILLVEGGGLLALTMIISWLAVGKYIKR